MTKGTKAAPRRIDPSDRDGDNKPGGSLPGNETAPMLEPGLSAVFFALRDAGIETDSDKPDAILPGDVAALTPEQLEQAKVWAFAVVEARAAGDNEPDALDFLAKFARAEPATGTGKGEVPELLQKIMANEERIEPAPWTRDDPAIFLKLGEKWIDIDPAHPEALTEAVVATWSDDQAKAAEAFADAMNAPDMVTDDDGEWLHADGSPIEVPDVLVPYLFAPAGADETFTAEEIAAGQTEVVEQEGEVTATAADSATVIDNTDPLTTVQTETAPIAVRLRELNVLISSRRLYKSPEGYSAIYAPPFIETATVESWINAGLAEDIPTGGNCGAVRVTAEARSLATRLRNQLAETA